MNIVRPKVDVERFSSSLRLAHEFNRRIYESACDFIALLQVIVPLPSLSLPSACGLAGDPSYESSSGNNLGPALRN